MSPKLPVLRLFVAAGLIGLAVAAAVGALLNSGRIENAVTSEFITSPSGRAAVAAGLIALAGVFLVSWFAIAGARPAGKVRPGEKVVRRDPAVALLALLQREGRLVDFLREDISSYPDAQVGAAVREIHASCRRVLEEHLALEPVRGEDEGARVLVDRDFDASAVRLIGSVSGKPPFRGVLRHRGWRTRRVDLPADPLGQDPTIVAPAEVEIA